MVSMVVLLSVISFIGCETIPASEQQEVAKYSANLSYTPASQAAPGSGGVTFAIANFSCIPSNVPSELWMQELVWMKNVNNGKLLWFLFPQFDNLIKASKDDLSKILMAKGFSIRGPFDSYDLIPYSDKKAIDLYLIPTLELSFAQNEEKWTEKVYSSGNVVVNGKITLELREIVTRELMWTKSIPLTEFEFPYRIRAPYKVNDKFNFIMNEAVKGIELQYPNLMSTIFKLIDPEEMNVIKKQCQELKSKKGF